MRWRAGGRERALASVGIATLALALYGNTAAGDYVFDDHAAIQVNPDVRSNTPLSSVFSNDFWGLPLSHAESHKSYRPLTVLSFRLNHHLHELWAPGFHTVNIATHALVCVLFFVTCMELKFDLATSVSAGLLFTSHPIHTEAVANIVGRSELLMAIFFLLSLICYQKAHRTNTLFWLLPTLFLSAVSLLCKEQGVTVLGLCLAMEFVSFLRERSCLLHTIKRQQSRAVAARSLILFSGIAVLLFLRIIVIGRGTPTFIDSDNPASFSPSFKTRVLTYTYICAVNVWLLVCPSHLCHDWSMGSIPLIDSVTDVRNITSLALCVVALTGSVLLARRVISIKEFRDLDKSNASHCWASVHANKNNNNSSVDGALTLKAFAHISTCSKKRPLNLLTHGQQSSKFSMLVVLSVLWTVVPFLPASNLFFPVGFVVAERVLYLPSMGFCLLIALGINSFRTRMRWPTAAVVGILVLLFSAKTLVRNSEWQSTRTLVAADLRINSGNAKLHMSMGNELAQQGDRRCEGFYRNAIRLRPQYTSAWANLGLVLINTERPKEAEEAYLTALGLKPDHINANTNMGHLCRLQQRWDEARKYFTVALTRRPETSTLHYFVGVVSEELGTQRDLEVAMEAYEKAVQYNPQYWEAHQRLGRLLASDAGHGLRGEIKTERLQKALYHYQRAKSLKSDDTSIQTEIQSLLLKLDKTVEAKRHLDLVTQHSTTDHHSKTH